jgi:hypothetical protein
MPELVKKGHLPPGLTTLDTLARSKMPKGFRREQFLDALNASTYVYYYSNGSSAQSPANLHQYCENLSLSRLTELLETPEWQDALVLRGILKANSTQLTEQQILALSVLTNITSNASLKTRLDRVGVPYYQFQGWLRQPLFAQALRKTSEGLLQSAQSLVDLNIINGAVNAKSLEWIKYFKEVNGSAPKAGQLDTGALLRTIVDIMTRHVKDPEVLRAIGGELAVYLPTFQLEP